MRHETQTPALLQQVNLPQSIRIAGITQRCLEEWLEEALSQGGEYADVFLEYTSTRSITLDQGMVKSPLQSTSFGMSVRVLSGESTGFASTNDFNHESIREVARMAGSIARGPARIHKTAIKTASRYDDESIYSMPSGTTLTGGVELTTRADRSARASDSRVFQLQATYTDCVRHILIATSDGNLSYDCQSLAHLAVSALVQSPQRRAQGPYVNYGGRITLDALCNGDAPERLASEAVRLALVQLDAAPAPSGEMTVVLGPGSPGVLVHEAVGHGLEADFNRKGISAFCGRMGQQVASSLCTVIDDGTVAHHSGSINVDDEGVRSRRNVLIENGVLSGYLHDRLSSRSMGCRPTGNGRRQNYQHLPMPRMTNTFLLPGESDPAEIIGSVSRGIYIAKISDGEVDITNGNFVFNASECYLIEEGRLTRPLRRTTLLGNGSAVLRNISRVGSDFRFDDAVEYCSKNGQSVPVGFGMPTIRIDQMVVGGSIH